VIARTPWGMGRCEAAATPGRHQVGLRPVRRTFAPVGTELCELAGAAGLRWTVEECFQRTKDDLGLDHCEARSWQPGTDT